MRIGLVLPGFSASERDWCIPALYNFVRTLARENDVGVFALEYPYRRDQYKFFGATVYSLNGRHRSKLYAPRLWSDALAAIFAEHRRKRFDVLHAFWANESALVALAAARALSVPMIVSVAGGELVRFSNIGYGGQLHWVERSIVNWVLKGADRVTVGSHYLQAIAARWRADTRIAPLGVDTEMFSPQRASTRPASTKIINVASLLPIKQQEILLAAFAQLKLTSELEIVGGGAREEFLKACATELGVSDRVNFSGEVAHDLLPQKYHAADIFVQSSLHEAQGVAALEAAACGLAIAGTPVGVLPELAQSRAAVASATFDADSTAKAIERAIDLRQETEHLHRTAFDGAQLCTARKIAERDFSLTACNTRWMKLYHSLI